MVRNINIDDYEAVPRPVLAVGNDHPAGYESHLHRHRRAQLLYAISGLMIVGTEHDTWLVPPDRAVWIPAGVVHELRTTATPVALRSLLIETGTVTGLPEACRVVAISPLMRALILEAVDLPTEYDLDGRPGQIMTLLLSELAALPALPLGLPLPVDRRLGDLCNDFLAAPDPHATIDQWADRLGMSRRSFTRLFREQSGLSFQDWRQRACLFSVLPKLAAGDAVTTVALDLGYDSPAAFTSMFKRILGASPRAYARMLGPPD